MSKDMRFRQRFENYHNAFLFLEKIVDIRSRSDIERAALIQAFESAFELSWKVMKDYLESKGHQIMSPRDVIKQAFQSELITNGDEWLKALDDRNITTHTYDEATSKRIESRIAENYFPILKNLDKTFSEFCDDSTTQ